MLLIRVDKRSATPAFRQIVDGVTALVDSGALAPGERLPPTRALARTIGVHRSTVVRAYGELWALGFLESRPGSYSTVRRRARPPATSLHRDAAQEPGGSLLDWVALTTKGARAAAAVHDLNKGHTAAPDIVDFSRMSDPDLAPSDELRHCLRDVLLREASAALDYSDPAGYPPLREAISARMRVHGVAICADEVLITAGAQHAMDLVLRLLATTGDRVAVEAPTYAMALALLRTHELDALEIPLREDGMDLDLLEKALRRRRPVLVYTMPNFQNPTGITTGQAHRERLLELCERHGVPILEDGFEEEMKYFGQAVLPIKSMDTCGVVLYLGTFSKAIFPGLRLGWIAAPRDVIRRLTALQRVTLLSGSTLVQAAAARFCAGGHLEAYLRRAHRVCRGRMQAMLRALERHMPPGVEWTRPAGGYAVWLTVPGVAEETLVERLRRVRVVAVPGSRFFAKASGSTHLRLSIAAVDEERIEEGCRRLGRALARL